MDLESGCFGCGNEDLDQFNRAFESVKRPLCLREAMISIAGGADFKAHHAGTVPVAFEVNLWVRGVLIIARGSDAQVDVLIIVVDFAFDLIACVAAVLVEKLHCQNHVVQQRVHRHVEPGRNRQDRAGEAS